MPEKELPHELREASPYPAQALIREANEARNDRTLPYIVTCCTIDGGQVVRAIFVPKSLEQLFLSPLFSDRKNANETAIEFFERVYGSAEFLRGVQFYAHDLLKVDPKLYKNIGVHQSRRSRLLSDVIPVLPEARGRPCLSDEEFAASALREALRCRERNRRRQRRLREAARAPK